MRVLIAHFYILGSDMKNDKLVNKILIGCFLLILFIPNLGLFTYQDRKYIQSHMNREVYEFPHFSIATLGATDFQAIENWYGDRALFFIHLSKIWSNYSFDQGISSQSDQVIVGKQHWLFLGNAYEQTLNQYTGSNQPKPEDMQKMVEYFTKMQLDAKKQGVPFVAVVAPDKQDIYPEYLPSYMGRRSTNTRLDQLDKLLPKAGINFIDLRSAVMTGKSQFTSRFGDIYMAGDSHWNSVGAYLGFQAIAKYANTHLNLDLDLDLDLHPVNFIANITYNTDLTKMLQLSNIASNAPLPDPKSVNLEIISRNLDGNTQKFPAFEFENSARLKGNPYETINLKQHNRDTVLLIGDSFSNALRCYFQDYFYDTVNIQNSSRNYNLKALIQMYHPKLIVYEIVERNLAGLPNSFNQH